MQNTNAVYMLLLLKIRERMIAPLPTFFTSVFQPSDQEAIFSPVMNAVTFS